LTPDTSPDSCTRFEVLLAARVDGDLDSSLGRAIDDHLDRCPACRALTASVGPLTDSHGDHVTLPLVDTSAYALGLEVARGGMGRIVAARDLRVGRPVVVKELLGQSPQMAARFEREARVTARLQHPGIVPIYEIGQWPDGTPFYSMRMVEGRTLRDVLAASKTLDRRLATLPSVIAAAEAVGFAHAQRVIHRDLTPANIMVGEFGETVVIDWGLAKDLYLDDELDFDFADEPSARTANGSGELTAAGSVIGTATYMPPEQARGASVDERADVYALGAILYHVLAGTPPYTGSSQEVVEKVKAGPPTKIEDIAPGAPHDLVSIVAKAMAIDPAARYPSARELADELKRFQTGRLVEAHAYSRRELWRRWLRKHRAAAIATAAALGVIAIGAAVAVGRVLAERDDVIATSARLLEEQGRQELLAGNSLRAATWLSESYSRGNDSPALRFMLGTAMRDVEATTRTLDCGNDVQHLDVDARGERLVGACDDIVKVWRIADGRELLALGAAGGQHAAARFSHDGTRVMAWGHDGVARIWDASTGALVASLVGHHARIPYAYFSPDDTTVITTGFDGTARIWDAATGAQIKSMPIPSTDPAARGAVTPDGKMVIVATPSGEGIAFALETGTELGRIAHGAQVIGGDQSKDGRHAVTCGLDGTAKVWSMSILPPIGGRLVHELAGHTAMVTYCRFDVTGTKLLTTSRDGTAKVWDVDSGNVLVSVDAGGIVIDGRFDPTGRAFTTIAFDGTLRLWSSDTGALLLAQDDPVGAASHVFSLDGTRLYAARRDGTVREIDVARGRRMSDVPPGATVPPPSTTPSPFALEVDHDQVRVWSTTRALLARLSIGKLDQHITADAIVLDKGSAHVSADGRWIVTTSTSTALWHAALESRDRAAVAAVARRSPWRLVDGELVQRRTRLRGRIVDGDRPARTAIAITSVPNTIGGNTFGSVYDAPTYRTMTGRDGRYAIDVPEGRYSVEYVRGGVRHTAVVRTALP
jgi:WD40 repeat protein